MTTTTHLLRHVSSYMDFAAAKDAEAREMHDARHYYHGDQWTQEEISAAADAISPLSLQTALYARSTVVGLTERLSQDPKAIRARQSMTRALSWR